ncbi:MAG: ATP-binding protein [Actinobacteria bacterium]|nr:ATP-binding protein [Actinomycetota bacterium]
MIISVASGKGGTGKTTIATALAISVGYCQFFDFDVEAPNASFFLKPDIKHIQKVKIKQPVFLTDTGKSFEKCTQFCHYNAVAVAGAEVIFFPELCHGCGGCILVGPQGSVREEDRVVGEIRKGTASPNIEFFMGDLKPGSMRTTEIQNALEKYIEQEKLVIIDCPPGTSCSMVTAVRNSNCCILVTEPTPFGLNDLTLSIDVVKELGIPFGVIINRDGIGNSEVENYCTQNSVKILAKFPYDMNIARSYSKGEAIISGRPELKEKFTDIANKVIKDTEAGQL